MFKKTSAKLSLFLFLALALTPALKLHAQPDGGDQVVGTDPQPTGEPRPKFCDVIEIAVEVLLSAA